MDGATVRVPHRVAAMAQLIREYEQRPDNKNVFTLYDKIKEKAQEALDSPRTGQQQSTKRFYNDVLNNLYVSDTVHEVKQDSDKEQKKLI